MNIINFLFVYIFSGFTLSLIIRQFAKDKIDSKLSFLLGYGSSPLLISLFLYYLYLFLPGKEWEFYAAIIYTAFLVAFLISRKHALDFAIKIKNFHISAILKAFAASDINKKMLLFFIAFVMIFTLTRNIFYGNTYTDALEYLKQGFVYSQDRSLDRLKTKEPFTNFNKENPLYGPDHEFKMNKAIRPALPIFYSFFYRNDLPTDFIFSSIKFAYSYYFVLLIILFIYVLSKLKSKHILTGLTILLSCYFFTKLSYSNYKEIIMAYYSLLSIFVLYNLNEKKELVYAVFLGALCGLMSYINYSGLIISGIIFLLWILFFKSNLKKKVLIALMGLSMFFIFSGNEISQYKKFIFNQNFISIKNQQKTYLSEEFINRMLTENKTFDTTNGIQKFDILITKKLQGFTQFQFFGLVFWLFLIILALISIKKEKIDNFSKINLFFIFLFFFIFSDPLFLNPHKYAYVLSLGYRYTVLLTIFIVIFIAQNYAVFLSVLNKIKLRYLQLIILFSVLLSDSVRHYLSNKILIFFNKIIILTSPAEYYLKKVDSFLLLLALFSVVVFIALFFSLRKNSDKRMPALTNNLLLSVFFVLPFLFTLNNNQDIFNTFRYAFEKNASQKIEMVVQSNKEKEALEVATYINKAIKNNTSPIIIDASQFNSMHYSLWFYINNNQRLIKQTNGEFPANVDYEKFYFLTNQKSYEDIKENCINKKTFSSVFLLECDTR